MSAQDNTQDLAAEVQKLPYIKNITYYWRPDCTFCDRTNRSMAAAEQQIGGQIRKKDISASYANMIEWQVFAERRCQGVPFLFNHTNGEFKCGMANTEDVLRVVTSGKVELESQQ